MMSKRFHLALQVAGSYRLPRRRSAAIALSGLVFCACMMLARQSAFGEPTDDIAESSAETAPADTATDAETTEDSLLVETHEPEPADPAELADPPAASEPLPAAASDPTEQSEALEPVSEDSEHAPDVAITEDEQQAAAQFGAALSRIAQAQQGPAGSAVTPLPTEHLRAVRIARTTPASIAAARDAIPFEPAKFNGILAGKSTQTELIKAWGEPAESIATSDGAVLTYHTKPFAAVEVLIEANETVSAIKISLESPLEPKLLAEQLSLEKFDSVSVTDEQGAPLGMAFPERGVVFMLSTDDLGLTTVASAYNPMVSHVAIGPLDARAFALRAEKRRHGPYGQTIEDLKTALALDPNLAQAHWLLAEVYLATGQADLAELEASEAAAIEPENTAYRLRLAQVMSLLAQYDDAVHAVRAVLDANDTAPIVRAQALHEMARLASLGDAQIASKAIGFEQKAIDLADTLATGENERERRAAKELLVEAHLSIAEEVARQSFGKKLHSISQWIGRASGIAEQYIAEDGGNIELRLLIAQRALAAMASFKPTIDPTAWVTEAEEAAEALAKQSDDELWQQRIQWELGIVYYNALRVEHLRRETNAALAYGQRAIENLAAGAASRQAVHSSEQLVGQLYFQIGAVHAVHKQDHAEAAQWYDKATPLLTSPRPVSELYSPRREGEVLVSIGVTYWQTGRQSRALELTRSGTDLVELAVEDGILAKSSLAVPYGNLATMYQQLGETTNAAKYSELANALGVPKTASAARSGVQVARAPGNSRMHAVQNAQARRVSASQMR
jgi:hypothetical protein